MRPKGFSQCQRQRLDANPDDVLKHRVTGLPGPGAKRRVVFCHPKGDEAAVPARLLPMDIGLAVRHFHLMEKIVGSNPTCLTTAKVWHSTKRKRLNSAVSFWQCRPAELARPSGLIDESDYGVSAPVLSARQG